VAAWLSVLPVWADEAQQFKMFRQIFAAPREEWAQILEQNREQLDDSFFAWLDRRCGVDFGEGIWIGCALARRIASCFAVIGWWAGWGMSCRPGWGLWAIRKAVF